MTLFDADLHSELIVLSPPPGDEEICDLLSRLMHFGFIDGALVKVTKRAAFFQEPLLVEVRGRQIALSKTEALLVSVRPRS